MEIVVGALDVEETVDEVETDSRRREREGTEDVADVGVVADRMDGGERTESLGATGKREGDDGDVGDGGVSFSESDVCREWGQVEVGLVV